MNPTRETKLTDLATARDARSRQDLLPIDERYKEKLADLRAFVRELAKTDVGRADIGRRLNCFGPITYSAHENDRDRYGKLRRWLDRDLADCDFSTSH